MMRLLSLLLCGFVVATASGQTREPSPPAVMPHCLVSLLQDVEVSAQEAGVIIELGVREGEVVQAGAVVAQVDDEKPQLEKFAAERQLRAAQTKASNDIEVRFANAAWKVAAADLDTNMVINGRRPGSVPDSELRRQRLEKERTELQIDKAKLDLQVAQMEAEIRQAEVRAADANIKRRKITAPLGGTIIDVLRERGEWVDAGDPVVRMVQMDRLRVEGFLVSADYDPSEIENKPVVVEVELARGRREQFQGRVVFVSPLVEAGMKYRVRAEVVNRQQGGSWLLRPGMAAQMAIDVQASK